MLKDKVKIVEDRWKFIKKYVENKTVLDVGCSELVATSNDPFKKDRWLFEKIRKLARDVIGTDINEEQVRTLWGQGYNVVLADAERTDLQQTFDVVLAGELIEHLSNPGLFLDNMRRHLNENGVLIITTPNRFDFFTFLKSFLSNRIPKYEKDIAKHVFYFDINSLKSLAERHKFRLVDFSYYWTFGKSYDAFKKRIVLKIIAKLRPQFVRGFIGVFKKAK